ncbi:hypothetical protein PI125_g25556 [Phytophthora idaei]|nr:hypothetical protein PI125_g25556 [Phytophthora idaei]
MGRGGELGVQEAAYELVITPVPVVFLQTVALACHRLDRRVLRLEHLPRVGNLQRAVHLHQRLEAEAAARRWCMQHLVGRGAGQLQQVTKALGDDAVKALQL